MRCVAVIETLVAGEVALRVIGATELERLRDAGRITQHQHDAGARLRELWYSSGLSGHGASWHQCSSAGSWGGGRMERMTGRQEAAWRLYTTALRPLCRACRLEVEAVCVRDEAARSLRALRKGLDLIIARP